MNKDIFLPLESITS